MKIRQGYVSNSSSSSYIIAIKHCEFIDKFYVNFSNEYLLKYSKEEFFHEFEDFDSKTSDEIRDIFEKGDEDICYLSIPYEMDEFGRVLIMSLKEMGVLRILRDLN